MKLIVGLGNPGISYSHTRHNIGFLVVRSLIAGQKARFRRDSGISSLSAKVMISGEEVVLAMPMTFMNLSGRAVSALAKKYRISPEDLLVVCDDIDLDFGRIRVRPGGSSGGHRGLDSIIDSLGSRDFSRLRLGIGRPSGSGEDISDYVLSTFDREQKQGLKTIMKSASDCCRVWVTDGTEMCMNMFNLKSKKEKDKE